MSLKTAQFPTHLKTNRACPRKFESTYTLLVRSEDRERGASEILAYGLLIVSALFSWWQIAQQPFTVPTHFAPTASLQIAQATRQSAV